MMIKTMMNNGSATAAAMLLLTATSVSAFPQLLVNDCARSLTIGERIMQQPVAASANAPADQQNTLALSASAGSGDIFDNICGTTVNQGDALTIQVDPDLMTAVSDPSWTAGGGPNYILEAEGGVIAQPAGLDPRDAGCQGARQVNPRAAPTVYPLQAGTMTIRLLSAYEFGQVWASPECTVTVTGSRTVVQHDGYLVDNDSWSTDSGLTAMPYMLTAQQLLAGASSGFVVLEKVSAENDEQPVFAEKYQLDAAAASQATAWLQSMAANQTDIQVSVAGFVEQGTTISAVSLTSCASAATCDGFFTIPTDQTCLGPGLCIESSIVDEAAGTLTTTIVSNDGSWFGVGFSTPGGGMTGGGQGSDIFICSSAGLQRFLVTERSNPMGQQSESIVQDPSDSEVIQNLCVLDDNMGRMTFTRPLAQAPRPITPGTPQAIIWARGPEGDAALTSRHDRRQEVSLDLTNPDGGVTVVKQEANWILWCHIVFMTLSWGFLLPLAVVIANRTRNVPGGRPGAWFEWHKEMARAGWLLSTLGVVMAFYYCEVYSDHFQWDHTKYGLFVAMAGFFQPISAVFRPHPPKGGWPDGKTPFLRIVFEVYHKAIGWVAIAIGMFNIFKGAKLVKDLDFEDITRKVPMSIASITMGLFVIYAAWTFIDKGNPVSKALARAHAHGSREGGAENEETMVDNTGASKHKVEVPHDEE